MLARARADRRIVAGAELGSHAQGGGDRWSDLDLSFGVGEGAGVEEVLADWTPWLVTGLGATHLFDVGNLGFHYRVFLLPGSLQLDLSLAPAALFGALGPRFRLLFGEAVDREPPAPPALEGVFGLAVHHAVRARFSIERGRPLQAEHWIHALRDEAIALACLRAGLEARNGRGADQLPAPLRARAATTLAASLEAAELRRALAAGIELLLEAGAGLEPAARLAEGLRQLA